ncbi:hypothetical protein BV25DRAFT_161197 [Artomyces pyxidatus]|uniref:Uncharacterized protein n=1 Tax=Artomyces pyxidatus TaxID=48021 RepID=A0ACB8T9S9_9AGAM|nr:hypothetical protein BV25DRAFT_161197 [Artomyces pyxidatus]
MPSSASDQVDGNELGPQLLIGTILSIIPLVILYYDWLLTLEPEIDLYWPPKHSLGWVSSFFLLNRYLSLFGHIPVARSLATWGNLKLSDTRGIP